MHDDFDLAAYFARIGYSGPATPQLETLCELHRLHPQAIPFENLNPLLRWPIRLDARSLQDKLVKQRRGGYCYEHNLLLKHALERIGFRVTGLAARVLLNQPEDAVRARTHMLLQVDVEDEIWIADVGFGGMTLTAPLRLLEHVPQPTPHEPFRLTRTAGDYALQAEVRSEWRTLYRFDLQEQVLPDYELASWYLSNHPESRFVVSLIAARTEPQRRYALLNNELAIHELNRESVRRLLTSAGELRETLREMFGIEVPESEELEARFARMISQASA
jgi:N-hydroxyarylamine O-acetyltransferase